MNLSHAEIDLGLSRGEFVPVFQPVFDLVTRRILGYECLVRWMHHELGLLEPDEFLYLFSSVGLLDKLTRRLFEDCCRAMDGLCESQVWISLNLSPMQLDTLDLTRLIRDAQEEYGLAPSRFCFEFTEEMPLKPEELRDPSLIDLVASGVTFALDDFGKGSGGLCIAAEPLIGCVKIDRSLVVAALSSDRARTLLAGLMETIRGLGIRIVLEGIETAADLDAARQLGPALGQGFFMPAVSRLVPANAA